MTEKLEGKSLDSPEETREFKGGTGKVDIVTVGGVSVGRAVFQPGWRWSEHVKPLAGTESCQAAHTGYVLGGRMVVRMDSGEECEVGPGEAFYMPAGHDAWIVGDEPCTMLDFTGMTRYAQPA